MLLVKDFSMLKLFVLVIVDVKLIDGFNWYVVVFIYLQVLVKGFDVVLMILLFFGVDFDLDVVLDNVDGVFVIGLCFNVNLVFYGDEFIEVNGFYDLDCDVMMLFLIKCVIECGVLFFVICWGIQELNVVFGGIL